MLTIAEFHKTCTMSPTWNQHGKRRGFYMTNDVDSTSLCSQKTRSKERQMSKSNTRNIRSAFNICDVEELYYIVNTSKNINVRKCLQQTIMTASH